MPAKEKEDGVDDDIEEAEEITYTSYRPSKLKYGKDHPGTYIMLYDSLTSILIYKSNNPHSPYVILHSDAVAENSTLSAVLPPDITYNLAMPAEVIASGKLSNLQLEAIVYGCMRHLVDLPLEQRKQPWDMEDEEKPKEEVPQRGGFLLGDGAGMGKGRTLAGFVVENIARGRKKHVWVSVSSDLYDGE